MDGTTDALFRSRGLAINAALTAAGLVQTADTGQIDWATVTRPGAVNTQAGYEIWRFNDSLQGTAPIFLRIAYGTGNRATDFNRLGLWVGVGAGTNGAGTLTAPATSVIRAYSTLVNAETTGTWPTYMCHAEGFFGALIGVGSLATNLEQAGFVVARTVDSDGVPNGDGVLIARHTSATSSQTTSRPVMQGLDFRGTGAGTLGASDSTSAGFGSVPGDTLIVGSDVYLVPAMWTVPEPRFFPQIGLYHVADITRLTTLTSALIGTESRGYIAVDRTMPGPGNADASNSVGMAMMWE
jgi:hypothetical protein